MTAMTKKAPIAHKQKRIYESKGEPIFQAILVIIFILMSITFVYPYWHVLVNSFEHPDFASASGFRFWPTKITTDAYQHMFNADYLWRGYANTLKVCFMGWALSWLLIPCPRRICPSVASSPPSSWPPCSSPAV